MTSSTHRSERVGTQIQTELNRERTRPFSPQERMLVYKPIHMPREAD